MQSSGDLIRNIITFGVLIYLSLIVSGKIKLPKERQEKYDALMKRRGRAFKILVYGMTAIFGILILKHIFFKT